MLGTPFFTTVAPDACANASAGEKLTPVPPAPEVPTVVIVTVSGFAPGRVDRERPADDEAGDARELDVRRADGGCRRERRRGERLVVDAAAAGVLAARVVVGVVRAVDHDVVAVAAAVRGQFAATGSATASLTFVQVRFEPLSCRPIAIRFGLVCETATW